ncbi:MAG: FHA domain-containing protein [Blastocatellia bacterium]
MSDWLKNLLAKALGDTQSASEPLVVARAICEAVDEKVKTLPGGRKIFPYRELIVHFHAPTNDAREALRAMFAERNELQARIREHLERQQVEEAARLRVRVEVLVGPTPAWAEHGFDLIFIAAPGERPAAALAILLGQAVQPRYALKERNRIGRNEEVLDKHGRLAQRNDIVFADTPDEINRSVSRIHARIEFDTAENAYLLFDENSAQGVFIERDSRMLTIAGARGVLLKDGDVIFFGKARARFSLEADASNPW